jgi:serine/threonine-protein kinase
MAIEDELTVAVRERVGTTLRGKYHLEAVLGVGGMAAVYRATNTAVRRPCAVKILHRDIAGNAEVRRRFVREGLVANTVGHRGVVDVLDGDVAEDGSAFLVMELLEGDSVESIAEAAGGRLSVGFVLAIASELLGVLAAAHGKGVVHRDIKPANLFITSDGFLKVLDFGIAKLRDGTSTQMTRTGMSMGTPAFMAPEQALGRTNDVGPRTDLWAVGATMFNLLSGRGLHVADSAQQLMIFVATRPPMSLGDAASYVPAPIVSVVDRALAFAADDRWPDAARMSAATAAAHQTLFGAPVPSIASARSAGVAAPTVLSDPSDDETWRKPDVRAGGVPNVPAVAPVVEPSPVAANGHAAVEPFAVDPVIPGTRARRWPLVVVAVLAGAGVGGWILSQKRGLWDREPAMATSSVVAPAETVVASSAASAAPVAPVAVAAPSASLASAAHAGATPVASASAGRPSRSRLGPAAKTRETPPRPRDPLEP